MISLKVKTEYSLQSSLIKIKDLISFLCKHNIDVCGICDDELFGVIEFYNECINNNIKPIIGLEINIDDKKVCIYPKNYEGYKKLLKINTTKFERSITEVDLNDDNLLIVIPYKYNDIYELFNKDNTFLGYENEDEKKNTLLLTKKCIPFKSVRTLDKKDIKYLEYLKMLNNNLEYNDDYYEMDINEDDLKRLNAFANLISIDIPKNNRYIPVYINNSKEYLYKLSTAGLNKRLNNKVDDVYKNRLEEELNIINKMGFTDYFLIVYDYVLYAKKNNILVGPGRGSAAGSLVSYAIGITDIDPIKYDLLFARFLNPYRKKMPDIDIDFEDTKRMDVISYVKEKYGFNNVALGITFNSLKSKLVLRDLSKLLKIDEKLFSKFIKEIDANKNLKGNLENEKVKKYLEVYPELKKLYDVSLHLEGLKKNISTHAAGVVICSRPLDEIIPIYNDGEMLKTGIAMEYLEDLGLLKMDILALRNLTVISSITSSIKNIDLNNIDLEDNKTYELFKNADTDDIFQFESKYAKNALSKLNVSNFDELVIAMALVRPGPSSQIDTYIKNKGRKDLGIHPSLESLLTSTNGIIIFQEQVMNILTKIAGYTLYEADSIRIAISKKKEDIINKEEQNFISKAIKNGYEKEFATDLFNQIKRFADYGFNKAHAVSYAMIAYKMAYLKANYPLEFSLAILKDNKDDVTKKRLMNNLKVNNIKILKPNINYSTNEYMLKNNSLLLPFTVVKGLAINVINEIISKREKKYTDIYEFFIKCREVLTQSVYEILVKSGVLDEFKYNKHTLIENYDALLNYAELEDDSASKPLLEEYEEYDDITIREFEKEYFGFYIGNHPCSIYSKVVKVLNTKNYLFKNIKMALLVEKISMIKTKNNEDMCFINASDETGNIELTVFPDVLSNSPNININDIIFIEGKSSKRYDKYQIIVNKIESK